MKTYSRARVAIAAALLAALSLTAVGTTVAATDAGKVVHTMRGDTWPF